jgi:hypothetical protein
VSDEIEYKVLCIRADMSETVELVEGTTVGKCRCGADVYLAPSTRALQEKATVHITCLGCVTPDELLATLDYARDLVEGRAELLPDQAEEYIRIQKLNSEGQ